MQFKILAATFCETENLFLESKSSAAKKRNSEGDQKPSPSLSKVRNLTLRKKKAIATKVYILSDKSNLAI